MKKKSAFINVTYWLFRVGFWLHVALIIFLVALNYFMWNAEDGWYFTVRNNFYAMDDNRMQQLLHRDTTDTLTNKNLYMLSPVRTGFMRIDYTDFSKAFTPNNVMFTLLDIGVPVLWLCITFQLMKIIQSLRREQVFNRWNIQRVRAIGFFVIFIGLGNIIRSKLFVLVAADNVSIPGHHFFSPANFNPTPDFGYFVLNENLFPNLIMGLIILVIAEVFKRGFYLQEEKDLTV